MTKESCLAEKGQSPLYLFWQKLRSYWNKDPVLIQEQVEVRIPSLPMVREKEEDESVLELKSVDHLATYTLHSNMEFVLEDIRVPANKVMYRLRHVKTNRVIAVDESLFRFLFSLKRK